MTTTFYLIPLTMPSGKFGVGVGTTGGGQLVAKIGRLGGMILTWTGRAGSNGRVDIVVHSRIIGSSVRAFR